ncbi:alpha/beta hydrolase [Lutibaculum baratangense]|uniref:Lipoprotein n=1 Tax=Lutibaculum baratangense AMV1 TaxID=631454 RepID=V4RN74_9HYPH|nr:alpha/beta hydrolase [Lutibaculum baratangense]ESR26739.1 hypothetical protein N177_0523 [Lutibaculum baratangense AMV1]
MSALCSDFRCRLGTERLRHPVVILMLVFLAGCAGRAQGVLVPYAGEVTGTSRVEMLVATTRSATPDEPGRMFSGARGEGLTYADIAISIPPDEVRQIGDVQWPRSLPGDPSRDFVTLKADRVAEETAFRRLDEMTARQGRHVLVFIHGYNNSFEDAVYRLAQIVHDSRAPIVPVLFTWPSGGGLFGYGYDRESANYSRDALERLLAKLAADRSVGEITVLAHSMGNWVTLEALRQMAIRDGRVARKIGDVILAAPDVDVDVFRTQIAAIEGEGPRFTLFVSRNDRALAVSRRVWGSSARLGAIDPELEPYRSELERDQITVVDLTGVRSSDPLNHGTFAQAPEAVHLLGRQLASGQDLSTFEVGVGDRIADLATSTGATVGGAAGLIVSAPIAIVDQRSRRSYDDRLEHFGNSLGETVENTGELLVQPLQAGQPSRRRPARAGGLW